MSDIEKLMTVIQIQSGIAKLGNNLSEIMSFVCEKTQILLKADAAVIELVEDNEMVYKSATGEARAMTGMRLKLKNSLSGLCVLNAKPLYCTDTITDKRVNRSACRKLNIRSMIVLPLLHNDTVVGVLKLISHTPNAFCESDIETLSLFSELISAVLFHATRYNSEEIFKRATTDFLTGLANRSLFYDRLLVEINKSQRGQPGFSIVIIDLDNFKPINDLYGHAVGDLAIKTQANRLRSICRETDTVARMGGDEFAILLPSLIDPAQLIELTKRLEQSLSEPLLAHNQMITMGASIGTVIYPHESCDVDSLLDFADKKMYLQKSSRKIPS